MRETFWQKLSHLAGLLAIGVLFGLCVFAANIEIKDLDLWLHLKMGEFIVQHGYVPDRDILSCTITGKPWVNHEWLFQVIAYLIFHHWGAEGLITMQVVIVSITLFILLFLGYSKERQLGVIFILLLVMLNYQLRFTIRPDIFSLLFFAIYIYVLAFHIDKRWSVVALFFVQALWTNFHGFSFMGPFLILVGIASEFLKRNTKLPWQWNKAGRLNDGEFTRLKRIFWIVVLASLINPLTFKGAWYPISVLINIPGESRVFFKYIQELQPPLKWSTILTAYPYYKTLLILSFFGFLLNRKKIDIGDFFVWAVFLFISLTAIRNLVFFSFVAYLVCITNFASVSLSDILPVHFSSRKFQHMTSLLLKILLILWMFDYGTAISNRGYFDFDKYEMKSEFGGITQRNYPVKAVDFLVAHGIKGRFFNDFNSGAYLIGRSFPNIRVFIDGRTEVYGAAFFKKYRSIWEGQDLNALDEAIRNYQLTGIFLNSNNNAIPVSLLRHVYNSKEWVCVYFGYDGVIFLRDIPSNRKWIDELRMDLAKWQPPQMDLRRLSARRVTPYQYINRAFTLESLDLDDAALKEAYAAIGISPGYGEAYKIIGKVYGKREDYEKAFENFRIATAISPYDVRIRVNFGLAYEKLNDFKGAIRQYQTMIGQDPDYPQGYFMLSRAYMLDKDYANALETLKKAHRLAPTDCKDVLELGDLAYDKGRFDVAREIYTMALATKKDIAKVHMKIGLSCQKLGDIEAARKEFQSGLAIEANNEDLKKYLESLTEKSILKK